MYKLQLSNFWQIQQQVEDYLMTAEEKSSLAYMRSLHLCYSKVGALTKSLKEVFALQNIDDEGELAALLDQNFADIFVPYIESGRYFEAEVKNLNEIMNFTLTKFTEMHSHKLTRETSILSRFTSSSSELSKDGSKDSLGPSGSISEKGQGRIGQFMRAVRLERSNSHQKLAIGGDDEDNEEVDHAIRLEHIQKILSYAAESIKRDLELAESSQIPNDAKTFLHMLLDGLGRDVAEILLDEAITNSNQEAKHVDLSFLKAVRQVSGFIYLISSMVHTVIAPMLSSNAALKNHTIESLNMYLKRCETKMNTITQSAIDLCINRLSYLLAKQKKKDYAPKSDDSQNNVSQTYTCVEVSNFLATIHASSSAALDGENLEAFLTEIGNGFKDLLLDHFKRYNVNSTGGLIVSKDIQEYQESIDKWSVPELSETFSILHNIGNLFTVQYVSIFCRLFLLESKLNMLTFFFF